MPDPLLLSYRMCLRHSISGQSCGTSHKAREKNFWRRYCSRSTKRYSPNRVIPSLVNRYNLYWRHDEEIESVSNYERCHTPTYNPAMNTNTGFSEADYLFPLPRRAVPYPDEDL